MEVKSFKDLLVWNKAMDLVEVVYRLTDDFPQKERYRLTDQLCRAVTSIPSNIAEGSSRRSTKEFIRFANIAYGSLAEVQTQVNIAKRLSYLSEKESEGIENKCNEIGKMLNSLLNSLSRKLDGLVINTPNSELRTLNSKRQATN